LRRGKGGSRRTGVVQSLGLFALGEGMPKNKAEMKKTSLKALNTEYRKGQKIR